MSMVCIYDWAMRAVIFGKSVIPAQRCADMVAYFMRD